MSSDHTVPEAFCLLVGEATVYLFDETEECEERSALLRLASGAVEVTVFRPAPPGGEQCVETEEP